MEIQAIDREEFGKRVKAAREAKGLTQQQLGELCGVSAVTVISYEKGQKLPHLEVAHKISACLGVSLDELCGHSSADVKTFGTVIEMVAALLCSGALELRDIRQEYDGPGEYVLDFAEPFAWFPENLQTIYSLYQNGTIERMLFDLWIKNEAQKNNDVNIKSELEKLEKAKNPKNIAGDDFDPFEDEDEDFPF